MLTSVLVLVTGLDEAGVVYPDVDDDDGSGDGSR